MRRFLTLILFSCFFLQGKSQCTHFLGGDKVVMPCSNPFQINYPDLFVTNATFQITVLPPTDTIPGAPGTGDTVVYYLAKTKAVATLPNGCKDSATVRVRFRTDNLPHLGPDSTIHVCKGVAVDATGIYDTRFFSSYWNTSFPENITDEGIYTLVITSDDGCTDSAKVTVLHFPKPNLGNDTSVTIRVEDVINIVPFYDTAHLIAVWDIPRPDSVKKGIIQLLVTDSSGCKDTAYITVNNYPKPNLGPDRKICTTQNVNLVALFDLTGLTPSWNTATPAAVGPGTYTLIATNQFNSRDTCIITVINNTMDIGPNQSISKCKSEFINLASLFNLVGTTTSWNTPDPESVVDPGIYTVIATNAQGCKDTGFVVLEFNPQPSLHDTTVFTCNGNPRDLNLIFDLSPFTNIQWSNPTPTAALAGIDTLRIDDEFGCTSEYIVTIVAGAANKTPLNLCKWDAGTSAFTSNLFRSVTVDKDNKIWAGAEENGLYRFEATAALCGGTWVKSPMFPNHTHKDLLGVNPDEICQCSSPDAGIWVASTGNTGASAIAGGIYHVTDNNFTTVRYGSVQDPTPGASSIFKSRFANSITLGSDNRIYAGFSLSLNTSSNAIQEGGVYSYDLNTNPSGFTQLDGTFEITLPEQDIKVSAVGKRDDEVWFGVESSCVFNTNTNTTECTAPYIIRYNTTTHTQTGVIRFPLPFTATTTSPFARAIFTDNLGRTYVGLSGGKGLAVLDTNTVTSQLKWVMVDNNNSPLPPGTSINFNAITEVNGEIWIGTNKGLLVYNGAGDLNDCTSYVLYTTADSLPSNNITDVAYDASRQEVWITTDNGVCKSQTPTTVVGTVVNVSLGSFDSIYGALKQIPLAGAKVSLRDSANFLIDQIITDASGSFSLDNGVPGQKYKVVVEYANTYRYEYTNLKHNQLLGDVLIPDSLIKEIKIFYDTLKEKKFVVALSVIDSLFSFVAKGYDSTGLSLAYRAFSSPVVNLHRKRVEDLGTFYLSLATMYNCGLNSNKMFGELANISVEMIKLVWSAFQSVLEMSKGPQAPEPDNSAYSPTPDFQNGDLVLTYEEQLAIDKIELVSGVVEKLFEKFSSVVNSDSVAANNTNKDTIKVLLGYGYTAVKKIKDLAVNAMKDGLKSNLKAIGESILEDITKGVFQLINSLQYERFCTRQHYGFIALMATSSYFHTNLFNYTTNYKKLYSMLQSGSPSQNSLNKRCADSTANYEAKIQTLKDYSEVISQISSFTSSLAKVAAATVIGAELAPIFEGISQAATLVNFGSVALQLAYAYNGYNKIDDMSFFVGTSSGFPNTRLTSHPVKTIRNARDVNTVTELQIQKDLYNQKLLAFKAVINLPYDSLQFNQKFSAVLTQSKTYRNEVEKSLKFIFTQAGFASNNIAGFKENYDLTLDSFISKQMYLQFAFLTQTEAYMLDTLKQRRVTFLNGLIDKIINFNNAGVTGVSALENQLNNASLIQQTGYLKQVKCDQYFDHQYNKAGKIVYSYTNNGNAVLPKLYLKLSAPTAGFSLTSPDSLYIGTLQPGEIKACAILFNSPSIDTFTTFKGKMYSDSVFLFDVENIQFTQKDFDATNVYSVKNGDWNDSSVWSIKKVPTIRNKVKITHSVNVNISTAGCHSVSIKPPGQVQILPNKKLVVTQKK